MRSTAAESVQLPRFIEILAIAKEAYLLGVKEHHNARIHKRESYCTPKRNKASWVYIDKIAKATNLVDHLRPFSAAERKILLAAWDQGLRDEQDRRDAECDHDAELARAQSLIHGEGHA